MFLVYCDILLSPLISTKKIIMYLKTDCNIFFRLLIFKRRRDA